jgi:hypothetical protein
LLLLLLLLLFDGLLLTGAAAAEHAGEGVSGHVTDGRSDCHTASRCRHLSKNIDRFCKY